MAKTQPASSRKTIGLGFLPNEATHGFVISIPRGSGNEDLIRITEERNIDADSLDLAQEISLPLHEPSLRALIDRRRWLELAPAFWEEANRRLRANGLPTHKFLKNPGNPIPIHPSLGKELCILCWAVESAPLEDIPNALQNWEALAPEERWWLFTMAVATTGQALKKEIGWRKALRFALAENPFIKGEGSSPKQRRELLAHTQLTLNFD
ncbi:MAG: DUF3780 domain-containing protein [Gemmataceae bacterium]|nr:DUF3780 domain-containing protein [Gemmataceae bacterium]